MPEQIVVREPGEGRTVVVGGGDHVTVKVAGGEANGLFCLFEVSTSPGFGPPLHSHHWAEAFYVLAGEYEFDHVVDGEVRTLTAGAGATLAIPPGAEHTFRGLSPDARMLVVHAPAALEEFFIAVGEPVAALGEAPPGGAKPLDVPAMLDALARNGVRVSPLATPPPRQ